jgi:hypothetical protein
MTTDILRFPTVVGESTQLKRTRAQLEKLLLEILQKLPNVAALALGLGDVTCRRPIALVAAEGGAFEDIPHAHWGLIDAIDILWHEYMSDLHFSVTPDPDLAEDLTDLGMLFANGSFYFVSETDPIVEGSRYEAADLVESIGALKGGKLYAEEPTAHQVIADQEEFQKTFHWLF